MYSNQYILNAVLKIRNKLNVAQDCSSVPADFVEKKKTWQIKHTVSSLSRM